MKKLLLLLFFLVNSIILFSQSINGWTKFNTYNSSILSDSIYLVFKSSKGDFWLGTNKGISRIVNNTIVNYTEDDVLESNQVKGFIEDDNETIYFLSGDDWIVKYDGRNFKHIDCSECRGGNNRGLNKIENQIYMTCRLGELYKLEGTDLVEVDSVKQSQVVQFSKEKLLFLDKNTNALKLFDGTNIQVLDTPSVANLQNPQIFALSENKFLCSFYLFNNGNSEYINYLYSNGVYNRLGNDERLSNYGSKVNLDQDGKIWILRYDDQLYKFQDSARTYMHSLNGVFTTKFFDVKTDKHELYLGSNDGFIIGNIDIRNNGIDSLSINNIRPYIGSNGAIGNYSYQEDKEFNLFHNSGNILLYANSLGFGGKDQDSSLYFVGERFPFLGDIGCSFYPGPIDNREIREKRNWMFKVKRAEIGYHLNNYTQPNYKMPDGIKNWPAHGDVSLGEAACLAPFVDVDNDGNYDPEKGDYPYIRGDEAIYIIYNDYGRHTIKDGKPMNVEVHLMLYAYETGNEELKNTIFANYRLINRSEKTYHDFYAGTIAEFKLGERDDYEGCDTTLNMSYVYNGDNFDGYIQGSGFKENPPAFGITFLNRKLTNMMSYTGSNTILGYPHSVEDYNNYFRSRWKGGYKLVEGGMGVPGSVPPPYNYVKHIYPGDPVNNTGWTRYNSGISFGRARSISSTGPNVFSSGDVFELDIAYVYARDTSFTNLENLAKLKLDVQAIRQFYNNQSFLHLDDNCMLVGIEENKDFFTEESSVQLMPNPSSGRVTLSSKENIQTIQVITIDGKMIKKEKANQINYDLDLRSLSPGVYFIRVQVDEEWTTEKVVLH